MLEDRRKAERIRTKLNARWEGILNRHDGTIVDISAIGCFMLTKDQVTAGELVRIEIQLPTGRWIYLWAEVVYCMPEIGFALQFTGSTRTEETMLALLIDYVSEKRMELTTSTSHF